MTQEAARTSAGVRPQDRLVIGPGGSGRTHCLRAWVGELGAEVAVSWVTGSSIRPLDEDDMSAALGDSPAVLVVDDLQWCTDGALAVVSTFARQGAVWAGRRPWPSTERLRLLDDQLTAAQPATRLVFPTIEEFSALLAGLHGRAVQGEVVGALFEATGGSPGLAADAVASRWDGDVANLPEVLIDAVVSRVRRAGADVVALAQIYAMDASIDPNLAARALPPDFEARGAQRGLRAGGLTDSSGRLLPLVGAALVADLSAPERSELHDRIAAVMTAGDPDRAVVHLLAGSADSTESADARIVAAERLRRGDPARALALSEALGPLVPAERLALLRAEAGFHLGHHRVLAELDAVVSSDVAAGATAARAAVLAYGLDLRELRWASAAERRLPAELDAHLRALSLAAVGRFEGDGGEPAGPLTAMLADQSAGLEALAYGSVPEGLARLAAAVDDFDRLTPDLPLGVTPRLVASIAALGAGDLAAAEDFAALGRDHQTPGEVVSLDLQLAFVQLLDGRYRDALARVRAGEAEEWSGRDRLLLAVLDAALARRSGDTTRLRDAWRRADPVLVRHSPSWLLLDAITELLAAGAKLGHTHRIEPIMAALATQVSSFAPAGPARVNLAWLCLQVGLAANDADAVTAAADEIRQYTAGDARSQARVDAAALWARLMSPDTMGAVTETEVLDVAAALADGGEVWEASRLVGQSALDVEDPAAARRLLERARSLSVEVDAAAGVDPLLALGLSEREVEVARMISEGRTHKEVGSQLFISPKTVEHHVARIRQKVGAGTRAELLAAIRRAVDTPG